MLPVLITFFNRPELLQEVLTQVKKNENIEVYFAADGPRNLQDQKNLDLCWELVDRYFPNTPNFRKLVHQENLGCRNAMVSNITWFFDLVPYGVILEDDCVPNSYFFEMQLKLLTDSFCAKNFISVSGTKITIGSELSMNFAAVPSIFPLVWGWGTWASTWGKYNPDIPDAKEIVETISRKLYPRKEDWWQRLFFQDTFKSRFREVNIGYIDTWDYSLTATSWRENLLSLHLSSNSVVNIGFNSKGTHTVTDAPNWVPLQYGKNREEQYAIGEWDRDVDKQIATEVFNCNIHDFSKNQMKKVLYR